MWFWRSVLIELTASLIAGLAIAGVGALLAAVFFLSRRGRLLKFFGITSAAGNPSVRIYLSLVSVIKHGAMKADGSRTSVYEGGAVVVDEFLELDTITSLLGPHAMLKLIPPALLHHLQRRSMNFAHIEVVTRPCPIDPNRLQGDVLIFIGGPEFNAGTLHYLKRKATLMRFLPEKAGIEITRGKSAGQRIYPQGEGMNTAMIERLTSREEGRRVFILAGTGSNGTRAAMRYLRENWERLHKEYGEENFAICIQCASRRQDPNGFLRWDVLRVVPQELRAR